ncbi:hypothetical protein [Tuwongella immobilis]|uniref:Uncharacterized protein n=1 Tax=Tuwongella immobilis TaxID=692036 RepID=A0A6C2YL61_9BACT|nr:hypothetical protein [Tuwongella immobilis]VIP02166.1 unnamed protein product [Tuwongella immobilis]VTS00585.1 unnamed protein product [Tuwongella immobilis]
MQQLHGPLFFILTWDESGRQQAVGHCTNNQPSLYIFTDQSRAESYQQLLSIPHFFVRSGRPGDMRSFAEVLLVSSDFTHVVIDNDPNFQLTLSEFINRLPTL